MDQLDPMTHHQVSSTLTQANSKLKDQANALIHEHKVLSRHLTKSIDYNQGSSFSLYLSNIEDLMGRDFNQFKRMAKSQAIVEILDWQTQADYAKMLLEGEVKDVNDIIIKTKIDINHLKKLLSQMEKWAQTAQNIKDLDNERREISTMLSLIQIEIEQEKAKVQMQEQLIEKTHDVLNNALPVWYKQLDALKLLYNVKRKRKD